VCPTFPHDVIEKEIINIGAILTSQIAYLRAVFSKEGFTHILSFRCQIYIKAEDVNKIPSSILIKHENMNHRIFFTDYRCKKTGHTSSNCTENIEKCIPLNKN